MLLQCTADRGRRPSWCWSASSRSRSIW